MLIVAEHCFIECITVSAGLFGRNTAIASGCVIIVNNGADKSGTGWKSTKMIGMPWAIVKHKPQVKSIRGKGVRDGH
jgi:hypothetical protein